MLTTPARPVVLFDGDCAFCRRWVARLERWDRKHRLELLPQQQRATRRDLPDIPEAALDRALHVVSPEGNVFEGARALAELGRWLPALAPLRRAYRMPGIGWLSEKAYAWVARRRHRFGCANGACGT